MKPHTKLVIAVSRILVCWEHRLSRILKFALTLCLRCFRLRLKRLTGSFNVTVTNHHHNRIAILVIHTVYSLWHKRLWKYFHGELLCSLYFLSKESNEDISSFRTFFKKFFVSHLYQLKYQWKTHFASANTRRMRYSLIHHAARLLRSEENLSQKATNNRFFGPVWPLSIS